MKIVYLILQEPMTPVELIRIRFHSKTVSNTQWPSDPLTGINW